MNLKALVASAQNRLRLRIALKTAWCKEPTIPSTRLPTSDKMIAASLRDAVRDSKGKKNGAVIKTAFQTLKDGKGEGDILRKKVYTLVRAPSLFNRTKYIHSCRCGRARRRLATSSRKRRSRL